MNMTVEQKIGQMLMVGWQTPTADDIVESIKRYNFGNIILFTRNIKGAAQIEDVCAKIQETALSYNGVPCFISIDQEGGSVRRIYDSVTSVPGSMAIASASATYRNAAGNIGRIVGEELKSLGINMNLAPVVDINSNPYNPVIAIRSFGDDPRVVSNLASEYAMSLQESGVLACYKHFLGHGDVDVDSHIDLPRQRKNMAEIERTDLIPYMAKNIADAIMTAHILYPAIDDKFPASISKSIVYDILRTKLGYKGLVVTDCFEMEGLIRTFSFEEAAVFAINASTDIITVSHQFGRQFRVRNALINGLKDGSIPERNVESALKRISAMKEKYCKPATQKPSRVKNERTAEKVSESSIAVVSGKPFPIDDDTVIVGVTNYVNSVAEDIDVENMDIARVLGDLYKVPYRSIDNKNFNLNDTLSFIKARKVVLCLADSHLTLVQKVLFTSLLQRKVKVMLISLRTPYDVLNQDQPDCHICTFEYTRRAIDSLIRVLGGAEATGVCPVSLNTMNIDVREGRVKKPQVSQIVQYIKENYSKKLSLNDIADVFGVSSCHMSKLLKKKYGRNFVDILNDIRMAEAKKILSTSNDKIYEVAIQCGYSDLNYFSKMFKKYYGVTPVYYRNNYMINDR